MPNITSNNLQFNTLPTIDSIKFESTETSSIFEGHELKPLHTGPIFNSAYIYYWPSTVLFLVFALLVSIKVTNPKKIGLVFLSVFSLQASKQLYREDYKLNKRVSILLSLSFILLMSLFIFQINKYFGLILQDTTTIKQYLFFIGLILLTYIAKFGFNYFLSFLTANDELGREYGFNVLVFLQTLSVFLFPFIVATQYSKYPTEWFLYPSLIIWFIFYLLRSVRGFVISSVEKGVGFIYIFLYFCALEILPLLVLVKFLLINF